MLLLYQMYYLPYRYILVQSQRWEHQNIVWNLLRIINKDIKDKVGDVVAVVFPFLTLIT